MWREYFQNWCIELAPVYFNSTAKIVIDFKYSLNKSIEASYRIDNCVNEGFSLLIESAYA